MTSNIITIDLINDYSVNIGSTFRIIFQLCNSPDLREYTGLCQIRRDIQSDVVLSPMIEVLSKDTLEMVINFNDFNASIEQGFYVYDILFYKTDDRFYAIGGKIQLVARVSRL